MNKTIITPTFAQFVKDAIRSELLEVHTSMPGKIKEYDETTQKASITPLLKNKYKDSPNTIVDIPICNNVPVKQRSCNNGDTFIYIPVKVGDLGMLHFCERSIDLYLSASPEEGQEIDAIYHNNSRHHDLSDAWFEPGILPFAKALQNVSSDDIIIKNDKITITIDPSGKISITNEAVAPGPYDLITVLSELLATLKTSTYITTGGPDGPWTTVRNPADIAAITAHEIALNSFKVI